MTHEMTQKWMDKMTERIQSEKRNLDAIEYMLKELNKPSKTRDDVMKRLTLMMEWDDLRPQYGTLPVEVMMEELLDGLNYEVYRHDRGVSYIVGTFELQLIPFKRTLEVTNTYLRLRRDKLKQKKEELKGRLDEEYSVVFNLGGKSLSHSEAARRMTEIQIKYGLPITSKRKRMLCFMKNYISLFSEKKKNHIIQEYLKDFKKREILYKEWREEEDYLIAQELRDAVDNGLFDVLEQIEKESECFVAMDILPNVLDLSLGVKEARSFLEEHPEKEA